MKGERDWQAGATTDQNSRRREPEETLIYHLCGKAVFIAGFSGGHYRSDSLVAEGFIHCAGQDRVVAIANDLFSDLREPILVLEIDTHFLESPVRWEEPAPLGCGGETHLSGSPHFPHVYGPIEAQAIRSGALMQSSEAGFVWPNIFWPLDELILLLSQAEVQV